MESGFFLCGLWCATLALGSACLPAMADAPKPDSGKFNLLIQGRRIGADSFRLLPDGCDSDVAFSASPGQDFRFHQTLKFKKGLWTQLSTDAGPQGAMMVLLAGDKSSLKVGDKPAVTQKLPAATYPYGDHSPHLLAFLVAAYDAKKGGEQKFDLTYADGVGPKGVLILPAILKDMRTSLREIGGKPLSITRYALTLTGPTGSLAMEVVTDKDRHILFWNVPAQKYAAVREGFDDLAK